MAAPTFTNLIAPFRDTADQSSYVTASVTPTANRLLFLAVSQKHASTDQAAPTVQGGGVSTWTQVSTITAGTRRRLTVFRALTGGSPTSGAITITMPAVMGSVNYHLVEVNDCVLTGTNGADAIPQAAATDSDTTGTVTTLLLSTAWTHADNRGLSFFYNSDGGSGTSYAANDTGFTSLGSAVGGSSDNAGHIAGFYGRNGSNLDLGATYSSAGTIRVGIGIEIAAAVAANVAAYTRVRRRTLSGGLN